MIDKNRLNLSVDPPPDLAIEIDVTSKTQLSAYVALGVPELWCYADSQLQIFPHFIFLVRQIPSLII